MLEEALIAGMDLHVIAAIAKESARCGGGALRLPLKKPEASALSTWAAAERWIEASLAQGAPVIVTFEGGLERYSVIAAASATKFYLFGSADCRQAAQMR